MSATAVQVRVPATRAIGPDAVAHAVHGLVLFVAVLGATFVADYRAGRMLVLSAGAVVLFWATHVYATVLARQGGWPAVWQEARRALPLIEACIVPALPLLLAGLGLIALPLAYAASVTIGVATLAAVGFLAVHQGRAPLRRSVGAALATGGLGAAIIAAETFWH